MGLFGLFGGKKSTEPVIPQRERIQAQPEKPKQQSTSPVQKASQESENIRRLVEAKATITEEIRANLAGCKGVFTAYYSGVTVAQDTDIRRIAKKTDCIFKVYKNLDFTKAVQGTEYEEAGNRQGPHVYGFLQSMDTINQIGLYAKNHEIDFAVNYLKIDGKKIDYDSYIMGVMDNIAAEKKAIAGTVSPNGRVDIEDVYFSFKSAGWDKINVIKVVRDIAGLGLKEAKEIVEGFGSTRMALGIGRNVFKKAVERIGSFGAVMQFSVKDGPKEDLDDLDDFLRRVYFAGETAGMAEAESKSEVKVASASGEDGPFALYIVHTGVQKVAVIKEIRDITGWGLKESKQYADTCDYERIELMEFDSKLAAQKAARQLSEVGAEVEISVK